MVRRRHHLKLTPDPLTYEQYVELVTDLLSRDGERMSAANQQLFKLLTDSDAQKKPASLALLDVEARLQQIDECDKIY